MVWQEGLVGCSPHRLGSPSLSPFRLVVGTGPGYLFKSQGSLGVAVLYHPIPPFLRQEAAVCGWPPAGGTTGKCKVECRLLLCTCLVPLFVMSQRRQPPGVCGRNPAQLWLPVPSVTER